MRTRLIKAAVLCAATAVVTLVGPPLASADSCDPAIAACPNYGTQPSTDNPSLSFSPTTIADNDQYPFDGDWYFNQNIDESGHSGGHSSGGGGHGR
ncbi:MAG: hypothetical protein WCE30_00295 [Mycobacterium sp.]